MKLLFPTVLPRIPEDTELLRRRWLNHESLKENSALSPRFLSLCRFEMVVTVQQGWRGAVGCCLSLCCRNCRLQCADGWLFGDDLSSKEQNIHSKINCLFLKQLVLDISAKIYRHNQAVFAFVEPDRSCIFQPKYVDYFVDKQIVALG